MLIQRHLECYASAYMLLIMLGWWTPHGHGMHLFCHSCIWLDHDDKRPLPTRNLDNVFHLWEWIDHQRKNTKLSLICLFAYWLAKKFAFFYSMACTRAPMMWCMTIHKLSMTRPRPYVCFHSTCNHDFSWSYNICKGSFPHTQPSIYLCIPRS